MNINLTVGQLAALIEAGEAMVTAHRLGDHASLQPERLHSLHVGIEKLRTRHQQRKAYRDRRNGVDSNTMKMDNSRHGDTSHE